MEVCAQARILLEPEFIVRLNPVDLAVLEGEEADSLDHLTVVIEMRQVVVLRQGILELIGERIIRTVADAEHIDAVLLEAVAEIPVVFRELRGDKDEIHSYKIPFSIHIPFNRAIAPSRAHLQPCSPRTYGRK